MICIMQVRLRLVHDSGRPQIERMCARFYSIS